MTESYLIVGCGVFGLSTALYLSQQGYKVTAIDKHEVPSAISAANDLNKIIRTEYSDMFYTKLAVEALLKWQNDPFYKDLYVESGRVVLTPMNIKTNKHRMEFEKKGYENLKTLGVNIDAVKPINSGIELGEMIPEFKNNTFGDITAKFNKASGFGKSKESLIKLYKECQKHGVSFKFGKEGTAVKHTGNLIITEAGNSLTADTILIAMGAATGRLVDLQNQIRSLGLFITHLHLNDKEFQIYKDIPIFFSSEFGYFFPPDPITKDLKFALTFGDVQNVQDSKGEEVYLPEYNPNFTFPKQGEPHVRNLLKRILPELSNHKLYKSKICWISDTTTSDFLVDKIPGTDNIYVATGDSGHGYKFLPVIGKYISMKLQGQLNEEISNRWRWKSNPVFPTQFVTRAKRHHFDIKKIDDWWIDSKL